MIRKTMVCLCFCFVSMLLCAVNLEAKVKLTEEEAQKILLSAIEKDKRYGAQMSQSCLTIFPEGTGTQHYEFSVHVNQGGNCPGNPNASPLIEYFQVNRTTGKVVVKNPHSGKTTTLSNQARAKKKQ
jgi:hypothetical protein